MQFHPLHQCPKTAIALGYQLKKTVVISVNYGFGGGVMTVTNAKSSAESEKFTLKLRNESGKLFTIECHFPPKSTNFGTLHCTHLATGLILTPSFDCGRWQDRATHSFPIEGYLMLFFGVLTLNFDRATKNVIFVILTYDLTSRYTRFEVRNRTCTSSVLLAVC